MFGLFDEREEGVIQLFQLLGERDVAIAEALKAAKSANGSANSNCLLGLFCSFLDQHTLGSTVSVQIPLPCDM